MKIKELIEKLNEFDENLEAEVFVGSGYELYSEDVTKVEYNKFSKKVTIS